MLERFGDFFDKIDKVLGLVKKGVENSGLTFDCKARDDLIGTLLDQLINNSLWPYINNPSMTVSVVPGQV